MEALRRRQILIGALLLLVLGAGVSTALLLRAETPIYAAATDSRLRLEGSQVSLPWRLLSSEGAVLRIEMLYGGCIASIGARADESVAGEVFIVALGENREVPGQGCLAQYSRDRVGVALRERLDDRRLIHAFISPEWDGPREWDEKGNEVLSLDFFAPRR